MNTDNVSVIRHPVHGQELAVIVPIADWIKIKERLHLLDCLEAGGVDNWDGYDFAIEDSYK